MNNHNIPERPALLGTLPRKQRPWVPAVLFFLGLWLTSMLAMLTGQASRNVILSMALVQDLLAFIAPAVLTGWLLTRHPAGWLGLEKRAGATVLAGVAAMFAVSLGALNYIVALNESMTLPSWAATLEQVLRNMEDNAEAFTELLLGDYSAWGLVSGLLVVGIIGPFAEEIFFRGALQRTLYGPCRWKAVWWTALIFSLMHFQMYGFVPRMLLGLWFGYLYLWTGSLWPSVLAHAINNSATVVAHWLTGRGYAEGHDFEIGADGNIMVICASIVLSAAMVIIIKRTSRRNGSL